MAALAEIRSFSGQEFGVVAAMGCMAGHAVFFHRRMFPHVGAAFVRVTFEAELVYAVRLDHLGAEAAVRIMAIGAGNLALLDGMVRLAIGLRTDILVAGKAEFRLGHLQVLGKIGVAGMTTVA